MLASTSCGLVMSKEQEIDAHIYFNYPDYIPDEYGQKVNSELLTIGLKIQIEKKQQSAWMSLEWAIPGLIAAYILKPYFESFLKEMGKDHYHLLKKWVKKSSNSSRLIEITTLTNSGAVHKIDNENTQSKSYSLFLQTYEGRMIKLLFDESLNEEVWNKNIDLMFEWILDNHESHPDDELTNRTKNLTEDTRFTYYAVMNKNGEGWTFYDDLALAKRMRGKNRN